MSPVHSPLPFVFLSRSFPRDSCATMCGENPALGLHRLFHVRTSGDIKGLQRGLSVCISPTLTVCARHPSTLSALRSVTARLARQSVENNMTAPAGCNCSHVYALADLLSSHTQALWGRSMFNGLSIVEALLMTVESASFFSLIPLHFLPLWHWPSCYGTFNVFVFEMLLEPRSDKTDPTNDIQLFTGRLNRCTVLWSTEK